MQSGQGQPQNTPQVPLSQNPQAPKVERSGTVQAINKLESPEDLVGFLKNHQSLSIPDAPTAPAPAPAPVEPPSFLPEAPVETPAPEAPVEPTSETEAPTDADQTEPSVSFKPTQAESLSALRKSMLEEKKRAKALEEEKQKLESKLKGYETGSEVPEIVSKKDQEIQRLSLYEKLHNLKGSEEYRTKFIEPLNQKQEQLKQLAADYKIPPNVIMEGMKHTNRADLNRFLAKHFDDVGALEAKELLGEIQKISKEAHEAEKQPEQALAQMQAEHQQVHQAQEIKRVETIANRSKSAWVRALEAVRKEGKAQELILREGDTEHNEKVAKVVLNAASTEFGKMVKILGENGIKDLPDDVSFALAKMTLLAHASAIAINSREHMREEYEKVMKNVQRDSLHARPPIGSSGVNRGATPAPAPKLPSSPTAAAESVLNKIGFPT